jgi:hypothetical protein
VGTHSVAIKDQVDRMVKVTIAVKGIIGSTVASELHATFVWARVCVLLPVSTLFMSIPVRSFNPSTELSPRHC